MKKVLLVFVLFGALSCSSDDSKKEEEDFSIVGNWKYTAANTYGSELTLTNCEKTLSYIEIKEGNAVNVKKGVTDASNESGCKQTTSTGTYVINELDKELIVSFYSEGKLTSKQNYFIVELTNSTLKLKLFRNSYFDESNVWIEEGLPEIKRTVFTYTR